MILQVVLLVSALVFGALASLGVDMVLVRIAVYTARLAERL